jgi:DNA gyrase subunit B
VLSFCSECFVQSFESYRSHSSDGKVYEQEYEKEKRCIQLNKLEKQQKRNNRYFYPIQYFTQTIEYSYDTLSARMRIILFE